MSSLVVMSIPVAAYAIVVRFVGKAGGREIAKHLGLTLGERRYYWWALAFSVVGVFASILVWRLIPSELLDGGNLAQQRFVGRPLTVASVGSALVFGFLETGLGEELFFRGLIAGWLGRRMNLWSANAIQAVIFTLPHLLILTADLRLWPIAVFVPFVAGLAQGWLRLASGSTVPGWLTHGIGNIVSAIVVMMI
jgi:membrane protease YdiL (CAAX protease family)